ncbi:MAG: ATP-binding protein [Hyphomicrobium sp.]
MLRNMIGLLAALWMSGAAITIAVLSEETDEVFDSALEETAHILLALNSTKENSTNGDTIRSLENAVLSKERAKYMSYQIRDIDGVVLRSSSNAPPGAFPTPLRPGFNSKDGTHYFTLMASNGKTAVQVAEEPEERREALLGMLAGFLLPFLGLLLIGAVIVWRSVRWVTQPIEDIARQIRDRNGRFLEKIEDQGVPEELRPIVSDTNRLLGRLEGALDAERAFSSNCAHELRNPIAAARAQAELIASALAGSPERSRALRIVTTLSDLGRRIERLLQLGRAEAGISLSGGPTDLVALTKLLVDDYSRRPVGKKLEFDDGAIASLAVAIDQDALGIAVQNLIDNALAHGGSGSEIQISVGPGPTLRVVNDGPAVPHEELNQLTTRFERGTHRHGDGYGLGLSIVHEILRQAGGRLELHSPATGRQAGFEALMVLTPA